MKPSTFYYKYVTHTYSRSARAQLYFSHLRHSFRGLWYALRYSAPREWTESVPCRAEEASFSMRPERYPLRFNMEHTADDYSI